MSAATMTPDVGLQRLRRPPLTLLLALCTSSTFSTDSLIAQNQRQEILSYQARVEIQSGGALRVTESIRVRAVHPDPRRGMEWGLPIRSATALPDLPDRPVDGSVELQAWTGRSNTLTREGASSSWDGENTEARFRTTDLPNVREALIFDAARPGGMMPAPTARQKDARLGLDWGPWVEAGTLVGLVLALYLLSWGTFGRDPPPAPRSLVQEPPEGLSPAALGFLQRRGYHLSQLTASLVSLAVEGVVTLEKDGPRWIIRSTGREPEDAAPEERRLYRESMAKWDSLVLNGRTNTRLRDGARALRKELASRERPHFVTNRGWFVLGLVASLLGFGILVWRAREAIADPAGFLGVWLAGWTPATVVLLVVTVRQWRLVPYEDLQVTHRKLTMTFLSFLFVGSWLVVAWMVYHLVPSFLLATAAVLTGVNVLFYRLLKRPTERGRKILDELEGFHRFLRGREAEGAKGPPPGRYPDLFQRHLPYAMVLGVEEEWGARFDGGAYSGLGERGSDAVVLDWYSGPGDGGKASEVVASLAGSFNAFVLAATVRTSLERSEC